MIIRVLLLEREKQIIETYVKSAHTENDEDKFGRILLRPKDLQQFDQTITMIVSNMKITGCCLNTRYIFGITLFNFTIFLIGSFIFFFFFLRNKLIFLIFRQLIFINIIH